MDQRDLANARLEALKMAWTGYLQGKVFKEKILTTADYLTKFIVEGQKVPSE